MQVIAVANQKGGCGKTTTSIHFSACLAHLQKKVLLIDLDPQGHSTCGLGVQAEKLPHSLYDLLNPNTDFIPPFSQVVISLTPHLSLLPSYVILGAIEEELANMPNKEKKLKAMLQKAEQEGAAFDYVVIDCPPNLGILTYNALEVAQDVIIPIEPSFFSLHGLAKISETLRYLNKKREVPIHDHALLTLFDSRTCFAKEVYDEVKNHFQERLFNAIIHESVSFKEAASAGQSIVEYAPDSQAFKDYFNLAVEYLERDWGRRLPEQQLGWKNIMRYRYGPRPVIGGVLFQAFAKGAKSVELVGDFNNWIPEPMIHREESGLWQIIAPVSKKKCRYKFIVDGEWQVDPYQPFKVENHFGCFDSYLEV